MDGQGRKGMSLNVTDWINRMYCDLGKKTPQLLLLETNTHALELKGLHKHLLTESVS